MLRFSNPLCSTFVFLVFGGLVVTLSAGCGSGDKYERVVVTGTVTFDGKPISYGQVHFDPSGETRAPKIGAHIYDGKYEANSRGGVPVGTHRMRVLGYKPNPRFTNADGTLKPGVNAEDVPPVQYLPEKYNIATELEITISADSPQITHDLNLDP